LSAITWEETMLEFAERILREVRKLERDTEAIVLSGNVADMERYRFLMGRLEGIRLVEDLIRQDIKKHSED
jgi:hypothetical protein